MPTSAALNPVRPTVPITTNSLFKRFAISGITSSGKPSSIKHCSVVNVNSVATEFTLTTEQCFIEEGLPEDVIPDIANRLNSELVVIGTVGRTGLSAALVGNTAEHVIDSLDCDVLALKPDGYVSPLAKD